MPRIVGIRFKPAGKIYDFECGAFVLKPGDAVIVETEQGLGMGTVVTEPIDQEADSNDPRAWKKIYRMAGKNDFERMELNAETEKRAFWFCEEAISKLGLQMNLFCVESTFDAGKMTFFFTADGRVDFRELVKILVREFRVRIEMRQVGIRNQAKMCGGLGRCGLEICCASFLEKFEPVSIRMAKEQNLSLNPTKISGLCGRLMCCLTYENEMYKNLKKQFPKLGKEVTTPAGKGRVVRHNIIANKIVVRLEDGREIDATPESVRKKTPAGETS
jgi:cell fate regulator YaaT (PSP1 superfamily)